MWMLKPIPQTGATDGRVEPSSPPHDRGHDDPEQRKSRNVFDVVVEATDGNDIPVRPREALLGTKVIGSPSPRAKV
jgi:hypothetical protein